MSQTHPRLAIESCMDVRWDAGLVILSMSLAPILSSLFSRRMLSACTADRHSASTCRCLARVLRWLRVVDTGALLSTAEMDENGYCR